MAVSEAAISISRTRRARGYYRPCNCVRLQLILAAPPPHKGMAHAHSDLVGEWLHYTLGCSPSHLAMNDIMSKTHSNALVRHKAPTTQRPPGVLHPL